MNAAWQKESNNSSSTIKVSRHSGRRLSLRVQADGLVAVRAPRWLSQTQLEAFVTSKADWIRKQRSSHQSLYSFSDGRLTDTTRIDYQIRPDGDYQVEESQQGLILYLPPQSRASWWELYQYLRPYIKKRLAAEAGRHLPAMVKELSEKHRLTHGRLRLRFVRSRWGSCNTRGDLMLNTQLMRLPRELREYVISHELAHTKHMNHKGSFYEQLESLLPDAKSRSRKLARQQLLQ